jgi:hypothetical protein
MLSESAQYDCRGKFAMSRFEPRRDATIQSEALK